MDKDDHELASSTSFCTESIQESPWKDEEIPYRDMIETNYHGENFTILQKQTYRLLSRRVNETPDALRTLSDEDSKLFKSSEMIKKNIKIIKKEFDDVMCLLIKQTKQKNFKPATFTRCISFIILSTVIKCMVGNAGSVMGSLQKYLHNTYGADNLCLMDSVLVPRIARYFLARIASLKEENESYATLLNKKNGSNKGDR